ncbi:MAG: chorismate synthase [Enterobacter hormaechei]
MPAGWGEPVFDRSTRHRPRADEHQRGEGVEIGDGFDVVKLAAARTATKSRRRVPEQPCGGILGGISSGQQIIANIALKPTSSITVPGHTINRSGDEVEMITKGRSIHAWGSARYRSQKRCWRSC